MKLSSAYLYEQLCRKYKVIRHGNLSEWDGYLRPFLLCRDSDRTPCCPPCTAVRNDRKSGHICIISSGQEELYDLPEGIFRVCISPLSTSSDDKFPVIHQIPDPYVCLSQDGEDMPARILNDLQQLFDRCDAWDQEVNDLITQHEGIGRILEITSDFLGNPLMIMGLDFSLIAETGMSRLPERARLFLDDGVNMEFMNALLQDEDYHALTQTNKTALFPAYLNGYSSLNRNLYLEGQPTYRLVLIEYQTAVTAQEICILEALAGRLEYLLSHEDFYSAAGDLEQVFLKILSDRTADYIQVSRQLSSLGWTADHSYLCLVLQVTYLNQKQLSTKAICQYMKKNFRDSISFLYEEELVIFFNLSRLGSGEEEVADKLVYFLRDSYLKAGYSRSMQGHMNLRRQYIQAKTALDVGSRRKPYLWIHHFDQIALPYIIEQATRRLPGDMLCHKGLLTLRQMDEKNHTEYVPTLKAYLEQHLSATQASKHMFIHRSTFLYRIERIREILQSELTDPDELFYLELSLRLLEQEEKKSGESFTLSASHSSLCKK